MSRVATILALVLSLALTGCATTQQAPQPEVSIGEARELYLAGQYEAAFPLMLEAAAQGNSKAQYAVGYMYYVGQGVSANRESALKWIKRAAEQGEPKAVEALSRMAGQPAR